MVPLACAFALASSFACMDEESDFDFEDELGADASYEQDEQEVPAAPSIPSDDGMELESPLTAGEPMQPYSICSGGNGGWSFCNALCPCGEGEGDCDGDSECQFGLECVHDVGANYGFSSITDVCVDMEGGSSQVPIMTSNNSPSGLVTRSGVYSGTYEGWKAFDASGSSMWISKVWQSPAWIGYDWLGQRRRITDYEIRFANGSLRGRAPKDWTLQGWNGFAWVNVDTRGGQTNWAGVETRAFNVAAPGCYSKYRLHVTSDNDSRAPIVVVSIADLDLIGSPC